MWLQHNRDSEVRVSFQYGGEPSALMDLWWFVSHAVLRGKRPLLEQETDRGSGMASEK